MAVYTLQGRSGRVNFHAVGTVTKESKKFSGKVTAYPIEGGSKISDHFERDPVTGSLQGILVGGGSAVATLERMISRGDVLTYTGSYRMSSIVLTSLDFSTDSSNKNGFSFTANYQKVERVSAQWVPIGAAPLMSAGTFGQNAAPAQDGLQTTIPVALSAAGYASYINTFNTKPAPSTGPASR